MDRKIHEHSIPNLLSKSRFNRRHFYGIRIHILVIEQGEPVEFFRMPGAFSDTGALARYNFDLPEHSWITGDKAYNDDTSEDMMHEADLELLPLQKKNSLRPVPP